MSGVLFNSARPLGRAENVTTVYDAYEGERRYVMGGYVDVTCYEEQVIVSDEFVTGKRPDQTVIMIAHGLTGGKLYGKDQRIGQFTPETCALIDWYVTSSEYGRTFAASASGIPIERCIALGMPRTDAYMGKRKGDGKTFLSAYERAYLYAPTFRAGYDRALAAPDWALLDSLLDDDEILVVKRHMHQRRMLARSYTHIVEVDNGEPSMPYLIDCDVLATDFSSILFDGYVLGKPSVLTADAHDSYLTTRGMYMRYPDEYGSRSVRMAGHERDFVGLLRDAAERGMGEAECECRRKVADACDGHSAERLIRLVRKLLSEQ